MNNTHDVILSIEDKSIVGPLKTLSVSYKFDDDVSEDTKYSIINDIAEELIESWKNLLKDERAKEAYLEG